MPWKITTSGGGTYQGIAAYIVILFTRFGVFIAIYILIGVFHNTAPPHIPSTPSSLASLHSWVQYCISIFFWPLSFWHPVLTLGKWTLPEQLLSSFCMAPGGDAGSRRISTSLQNGSGTTRAHPSGSARAHEVISSTR